MIDGMADLMELSASLDVKNTHKAAFRTAFDLLDAIWPPANTVDYFNQIWPRFSVAYNDGNPLCKKLILALSEYIEEAARGRGQDGAS